MSLSFGQCITAVPRGVLSSQKEGPAGVRQSSSVSQCRGARLGRFRSLVGCESKDSETARHKRDKRDIKQILIFFNCLEVKDKGGLALGNLDQESGLATVHTNFPAISGDQSLKEVAWPINYGSRGKEDIEVDRL